MERPHGSQLLETFATHLREQRGLAESTIAGQAAAVRRFLTLAERDPGALLLTAPAAEAPGEGYDPAGVDKRALEIYLGHLRGRGLAPASLAAQLAALRAFFGWLQREGRIARNPARGLHVPVPERTPEPPEGDAAAVQRLFERPPESLRESRLQLLLVLIYGGGLRPATCYAITALEPDEGDTLRAETADGPLEIVTGPAGIERARAYLAQRAAVLAADAAGAVPAGTTHGAPFWIDGRGRAASAGALGAQVRRAMERVGLTGGPAALRRLAARHFREGGADARAVQAFLGAKRLGRLHRYGDADYKSLVTAFRRAHPREQG